MENTLISIALCTYNGEKYIGAQLESIIGQTYKNLEIIIVDDRSTDNTFDIIKNYQERDQRIKCFRNEVNLGFNKNFERAIDLTTGQYISISDQDDIWLPNKIQVLADHIKDFWLICSNSRYMNADSSLTERYLLNNFSLSHRNFKALLLNNFVTGHTVLFSKELLKYALPFPKIGFYDWWMGFVAFYYKKITYVDQVLTHYRLHLNAVTSNADLSPGQLANYHYEMMCTHLSVFLGYHNLKPADKDYIEKLYQALLTKRNKYSFPLFQIMLADYDDLFSLAKERKGLSKMNFARRFAKKHNT